MTYSTLGAFLPSNFRIVFIAAVLLLVSQSAPAQTSAFNYNGRLADNGTPVNGGFQFEFKLYGVPTGGASLATLTDINATVTDGVFNVNLDFGASVFDGNPRYLEIGVRPQGSANAYTTFTTRQLLTSVPYTIRSGRAATAEGLSCNGCVTDANVDSISGSKVTGTVPQAQSANSISSVLSVANGGTGSATQNFVDLTSNQTGIGGNKTFTGNISVGSFSVGNARVLSNAGTQNMFLGEDTATANSGSFNTFSGFAAGRANTTGSSNSFFGTSAGLSNLGGESNSFFGVDAGRINTSGGNNSFFGRRAGNTNTTGNNNTVVGADADVVAPNLSFATAIGAGSVVSTSNTVVLGRSSDTVQIPNIAVIETQLGVGTLSPTYPLTVFGNQGANQFQSVAEFANGTSDTGLRLRNTTAGGRTWSFFSSGAGSSLGAGTFSLFDVNANASRLSIDAVGNVGIGTTAPQKNLSVFQGLTIDQSNTGIGSVSPSALTFGSSSGEGITSRRSGTGSNVNGLELLTNFQPRLTIANNGNVGIGTQNPTSKLEVNGNLKVNGDIEAGSLPGVEFDSHDCTVGDCVIGILENVEGDVSQIIVSIPSDGFLVINAMVHLTEISQAGSPVTLRLYNATTNTRLAQVDQRSQLYTGMLMNLSWVIPVTQGPSVTLKTTLTLVDPGGSGSAQLRVFTRSLSAVFIPKRL